MTSILSISVKIDAMAKTKQQSTSTLTKPTKTGEFVCKKCSKKGKDQRFDRKSDLTQHLETHSRDRPYLCDKCPARHGANRSRIRHIERVHLNCRQHSCMYPECGSIFAREYLVKDHERQHHKKVFTEDDDERGELPWGEEPAAHVIKVSLRLT